MNYLMILLRLIHIIGGVFWVGAALLLQFFVAPAVAANPEAGQKLMGQMMGKARLSARMAAAGGATVLAGAIMYWLDSDGFTSAWTRSGPGIGFGLGAVFGIIGLILGVMVGRSNAAMMQLGGQIKGKPSAEQVAQMGALQKQSQSLGWANSISLILAVVLMATARYFSF
jgi:uncharacterized membrane protein